MVEAWTTAADKFRRNTSKSHIMAPVDSSLLSAGFTNYRKPLNETVTLAFIIPKHTNDKYSFINVLLNEKLNLIKQQEYTHSDVATGIYVN